MTAGRIRLLDEKTINQIAAGEVIENPASVVKELVDNSIDANATEIQIWTKGGGRGFIKVCDNGCGMPQDDLLLALERHATSKLLRVEDLDSLVSLGFRGEALPSIASVSKMKLHSAHEEGAGNLLEVEGGEIKSLKPLPRRLGTSIEISSLFFNTPARKKFQKSQAADCAEIHKTLIKFILCYPNVRFTWFHEDEERLSFDTPFEERVNTLLGGEFSQNKLSVNHHLEKMKLWGYLSSPLVHRPNRLGQSLFINQRAVHSAWFSQKVLEGYGTRLAQNRFPLFVLHLTLPLSWIDVNVHPQKKEIRFREEEKIACFIREGVERALSCHEIPSTGISLSLPKLQNIPLCLGESLQSYQSEKQVDEAKTFCVKPTYHVVAQLKHFFFVQVLEGMRLVDIHRALERVIYDELNLKKGRGAIQALLLPIQMICAGKEREELHRSLQALNESGIAIRHFGGDAFLIDAIPSLLESDEIPDLIHAFIESGTIPKKIGKYLKRKAPSHEGAIYILERLFKCQITDFTPDGKRIHQLLDERALEKWL